MCDNTNDNIVENNVVEDNTKSIEDEIKKLSDGINEIKEEFESKVKYDKHKDKIIDELHAELQQYKDDLIHKLIRPIITDIIYTIDNNNKTIEAFRKKETKELDDDKLFEVVEGLSEDLEDILYRQGVEEFTYVVPEFDPKRQKIAKTVETEDKERDRTVAKSVKKGYMLGDRVIRHELVEVYVYRKTF